MKFYVKNTLHLNNSVTLKIKQHIHTLGTLFNSYATLNYETRRNYNFKRPARRATVREE